LPQRGSSPKWMPLREFGSGGGASETKVVPLTVGSEKRVDDVFRKDLEREETAVVQKKETREEAKFKSVEVREEASMLRSIRKLISVLTREEWVLKYCIQRAENLNLLLHLLIVAIPIITGSLLNFMHTRLPLDGRWEHILLGTLTTLHLSVVHLNLKLRLGEKINDMEKVVKMISIVLNKMEFAEHKPKAALQELIEDVEMKLEHSKLISVHEPPEWAFKLFDELEAAGKLAMKRHSHNGT